MKTWAMLGLVVVGWCTPSPAPPVGEEVIFPADAGIVDITKPPYAPRTSAEIRGAEGQEPFRKIAEATLARLRIVFTRCERTDYSHEPAWDIREIYVFDGSQGNR